MLLALGRLRPFEITGVVLAATESPAAGSGTQSDRTHDCRIGSTPERHFGGRRSHGDDLPLGWMSGLRCLALAGREDFWPCCQAPTGASLTEWV
jgi:hypothetical protein